VNVRVPIVALAATAAVAVASPIAAGAHPASHAAVAATANDPAETTLRLALQSYLRIHPRVTRAALARVKSRPLYFQMIYVSGAIGVTSSAAKPGQRREMCNLVKGDPTRFDAVARAAIFTPSELSYIQSKGWSVSSVVRTYRQGVIFGCGLRPE
jgi:hypothetical protein